MNVAVITLQQMPRFSLKILLFAMTLIALAIWIVINLLPRPPISFGHEIANGGGTFASFIIGKDISVKVPDSHGPKWMSRNNSPPLSAKKAIDLAVSKRKSLFAARKDHTWVLQHASLVPTDARNGYWYWRVLFFEESQHASSGGPPYLELAVMMDGTVVEPTIKDSN